MMVDGRVQIQGGKVLIVDGKVATTDECCCNQYPDVDYGCCEGGGECGTCDIDTGPDAWRLDWTGEPDQGEYDLACSFCLDENTCNWFETAGGGNTIFTLTIGNDVGAGSNYFLDVNLSLFSCFGSYKSSVIDPWSGNCLEWYNITLGYMTLAIFDSQGGPFCSLPSTVNLWPV